MTGIKRLARAAEGTQAALFLLGFVLPLSFFFLRAFPWDRFGAALTAPGVIAAALGSLKLALATSVVSTALGFIFSWLLWRFSWPRSLHRGLALLLKAPYLLPPFFLAMGWIALAAPAVGYLNLALGWLGLPAVPPVYGMGGAIFVLTLWSTALAMIQLQGFFSQFPGQLEDAAVICGASPLSALARVTLPLALPHLVSCLLLTVASSLAAFGVPALLASPVRQYVLTTRIFQEIRTGQDFGHAAILSLVLLAITALVLVAERWLAPRSARALVAGKASRPAALRPDGLARAGLAGAALFALLSCVLPVGAIVLVSVLRDRSDVTSFTLDKYAYVLTRMPDGLSALGNSLLAAGLAAATAAALALLTCYGAVRLGHRAARALTQGWNLSYALPGTVMAISLLVFYSGTLTDTLWILALAYLVKYSAFLLRTLTPSLQAISRELEEAAWISGASPARGFFRILVPMLFPALSAALLLAFIPMLSELTMSVFLAGAGTETLGTLIYRLLEYADPGSAAVLAVLLVAATLTVNAAVRRISKGTLGI